MEKPYCRILEGGVSVDDRGTVSFCNSLDFKTIKRFYMVENFSTDTVRGMHGHMKEEKFVLAVSGAALFVVCPLTEAKVLARDFEKIVVRGSSILWLSAGLAHGFRCLVPDTRLMFFSTATLEESKADDFRFPVYNRDLWKAMDR